MSTDDDGTEGSSIIWTIDNFSYCLQKLDSPSFTLGTEKASTFRLRICPRGIKVTDFSEKQSMHFGLFLENDFTSNITVYFALYIRTARGSFKKITDITHCFLRKSAFGHKILDWEELRGKQAETFLENDTITLRCRIWKIDDELILPGQCYARTIIDVERTTHIWSLEKFRQNMSSDEIAEKQPTPFKMPSLVEMKFIWYKGELIPDDRIKLEIKQTDTFQQCFLTCDLSLFEAGGNIFHSIRDEHWFDASVFSMVWTIPCIPFNEVLECEKPFLRCELAIASGSEYSYIERFESGKTDDHQSTSYNHKKDLDLSDSLKGDLRRFHSDGMFTDMTIRTTSKDFPVHKAILCARSAVFRAMFEQDMQENRSGVVNVEDVDADTVHKMLLFVYSDTVEDLDCDVACKLYFAADKYRITALRRKCSEFFKENLSVGNVCEVLILSDMHQDEDLILNVLDFIMKHAAEVMPSVEWKKFMQDHPHLAAETMHDLFSRKLNCI